MQPEFDPLTHKSDYFPHDQRVYLRHKPLLFSSLDSSHCIIIIGWSLNEFITIPHARVYAKTYIHCLINLKVSIIPIPQMKKS